MATTAREPVRPRSRAAPSNDPRPANRSSRYTRTEDTAPPAEFVEPPRRAERPAKDADADRSSENMRRLRSPFTPDDGHGQQ